jgi:hypothetical protein
MLMKICLWSLSWVQISKRHMLVLSAGFCRGADWSIDNAFMLTPEWGEAPFLLQLQQRPQQSWITKLSIFFNEKLIHLDFNISYTSKCMSYSSPDVTAIFISPMWQLMNNRKIEGSKSWDLRLILRSTFNYLSLIITMSKSFRWFG